MKTWGWTFGKLFLCRLSFVMFLFLLTGCDIFGIGDSADKIVEILDKAIAELTRESADWRRVVEETKDELPSDIREQVDLALNRAIAAAGVEFKCDVDFVRKRIRQDLIRIKAEFLSQNVADDEPTFCHAIPSVVIAGNTQWIEFFGYDFDKAQIRVHLQDVQGREVDVSKHLDDPSHYLLTLNLDTIQLYPGTNRFSLSWNNQVVGTIAINHPTAPEPLPLPAEYWTDSFSEEGSDVMICKSGFAVAGVSCHGSYCDNKRLLCRPYLSSQDNAFSAYWHPKVISEEQPNASFRTDILPEPGFVSGLGCNGRYCDNISFYVITTPHIMHTGQWEWKPFFSEESPGRSICAQDQFVTGVGCKGDYCDSISLHCSTIQFND